MRRWGEGVVVTSGSRCPASPLTGVEGHAGGVVRGCRARMVGTHRTRPGDTVDGAAGRAHRRGVDGDVRRRGVRLPQPARSTDGGSTDLPADDVQRRRSGRVGASVDRGTHVPPAAALLPGHGRPRAAAGRRRAVGSGRPAGTGPVGRAQPRTRHRAPARDPAATQHAGASVVRPRPPRRVLRGADAPVPPRADADRRAGPPGGGAPAVAAARDAARRRGRRVRTCA